MALLIEIVGPAGAGKSALARALTERLGTGGSVSVWGQRRRDLAQGALVVLPAALIAALTARPLALKEMTQMARVGALRRTLDRERGTERRMVVLDEGPVFALAWFDAFYGRNGDAGWSAWRRRAVTDWAKRLDVIIRLDADAGLLAHRIRRRDKDHRVKEWEDAAIHGFQARYRAAFDKVIADLRHAGNVKVIDMRSDDLAPEALAEQLASTMTGYSRGR